MSDFFSGAIGGLANGIGQSLGGPKEAIAERGNDYAPVTNINAIGAPDLKAITDLVHSINADNAYTGGLAGVLKQQSELSSPFSNNTPMMYIVMGGIGLLLLLAWKRG